MNYKSVSHHQEELGVKESSCSLLCDGASPLSSSIEGKVVVAMSGGVDSSVAALLLKQAGHDIVGVSMQVWDYRNQGGCSGRATCCAPSDFADARLVANSLGVPYYVFDFEKHFHEKVISRFLDTYARGETPNPCVDCNNDVKFRELRERALSLGCASVATGHYVRLEMASDGYHVFRGRDDRKDQSYFLYGLRQEELAQTLFPLGDYTKQEVRELARAAGICTAEKPESQDICFVSGSIDSFVGARLGNRKKTGKFVTREGRVLGEHSGIHQFTVGQRKGLGISGSLEPLYVIEIHEQSGEVLVGPKNELEVGGFEVGELNWVNPELVSMNSNGSLKGNSHLVTVQVRHKHRGVRARLTVRPDGVAAVEFVDEWTSPAPGQAAVFYNEKNEELLGGGRILGNPHRSFSSSTSSRLKILAGEERSDSVQITAAGLEKHIGHNEPQGVRCG